MMAMSWALFTFANQRETLQKSSLISGWVEHLGGNYLCSFRFRPWVGHGANPPSPYSWRRSVERASADFSSAKKAFPGCLLGSDECFLFIWLAFGTISGAAVAQLVRYWADGNCQDSWALLRGAVTGWEITDTGWNVENSNFILRVGCIFSPWRGTNTGKKWPRKVVVSL